MTLFEEQTRFTRYLGLLIEHAFSLPDVALTLGEGYNGEGEGHMAGSLHYARLAQDLNLFVKGQYITGDHPIWHQLAAYWKSLDPLAAWGGDFSTRDFNHFSLRYSGRA